MARRLYKLGGAFRAMGVGMSEAVEVLTGPARPILDRWFDAALAVSSWDEFATVMRQPPS